MSAFQPRVIQRSDPSRVEIEWADGHRTVYTPSELRRLCPCAQCVNEVTGERMLDPASVPDGVTLSDLRLVGNYAVAVRWSDGHETGIYAVRFGRETDPEL